MGKGNASFKVCIYQSLKHSETTNESVELVGNLRSWEVPSEHDAVVAQIKIWILKARKRFHLSANDLPMPKLSYALKGNTMGMACWEPEVWTIRINPVYLEANAYEQIMDTIPHEVCHLVTRKLHGKNIYPHGREWQTVCLNLGHYPSVTCNTVGSYKETVKELERKMINDISVDDF